MQLFKCTNCSNPIYFENIFCGHCGFALGFSVEEMKPLALFPGDGYQYCANQQLGACNWLVSVNHTSIYCRSCELNRTIPNLSNPEFVERWKKLETAKRRLVYSLLQLGLPVSSKERDPAHGLAFDFVADLSDDPKKKIFTGYEKGLITINISEADDIEREMARRSMQELYRTLLGHFRHEIGHYYWERLIDGSSFIDEYRTIFGDERVDYAEALKVYYKNGAPADWLQHYISAYASSHSWEDWAETWAHYMHITDTVETAYSFGLRVDPAIAKAASGLSAEIKADPYIIRDFEAIYRYWLPLTFAMNSLNRSMGISDLYPFVISDEVKNKLTFIHKVIRKSS